MALDVSKIGKLGFGTMRFAGHEDGTVDIDYTCKMIDAFMEGGFNYFDTAWAYPNSESTLREALVKRYPRDSFILASKCCTWTTAEGHDDLERQFNESLENAGVDYLDIYLMHNLGGNRTQSFIDTNAWEFVKAKKEAGLAKHIGFSAHCTPEELEGFFQAYPEAELVQLQVNYNDWESPAFQERACCEVAQAHGVPIIVMEPVKGGMLADPPASVKKILDAEMPGEPYAATALRFAASVDNVACVLSGMNTLEMVEENVAAFKDFKPFSSSEYQAIDKARQAMEESGIVPCTSCDYCAKVCPSNIGISGSMTALNYFINFGDAAEAAYQLGFIVRFNQGKAMPSQCIHCGACEEACPQNIEIRDMLDRICTEITPFAEKRVLMRS